MGGGKRLHVYLIFPLFENIALVLIAFIPRFLIGMSLCLDVCRRRISKLCTKRIMPSVCRLPNMKSLKSRLQ
jgi:hypothetical protein